MNENTKTFATRLRTFKPHSTYGWADFALGDGYPPDYDSWPEVDQRNYENGRLRAANAELAFGVTPVKQTHKAIQEANRLVGRCLPPRRIWR